MADHSSNQDNYVEKKTWDEAMKGKKAEAKADGKKPDPKKNEARNNGGGSDEQK